MYNPTANLDQAQLQSLVQMRRLISSGRLCDDDGYISVVASEEGGSQTGVLEKEYILTEAEKAYCSDMTLLRYLRARDYNVHKAIKMLHATLVWRKTEKIDELTCDVGFVKDLLSLGKMYCNGYDRTNRPIIVLGTHQHDVQKDNREKLMFMVYMMEQAIHSMDEANGVEKMVWICDLGGYNMQYNGSIAFAISLVQTLQNHFPERLGKAFYVNAPWVFRAAFRACGPFLDAKTKDKLVFCSSLDELKPFIDDRQIETRYGGTLEYEFDADSYIARSQEADARVKASAPFEPFYPAESTRANHRAQLAEQQQQTPQ